MRPQLRLMTRSALKHVWNRDRTLATLLLLGSPVPALAHGTEGAIVLLLPTGYYIMGTALAVLASFLMLSVLPVAATTRMARARSGAVAVFRFPITASSTLSCLILALMVAAGFLGPRDPLLNPLPAFIWTMFWVCLPLLHGLLGPLWTAINPWSGPLALLRRLTGSRLGRIRVRRLPARSGFAIAILQFFAFAWFELIDPAPSDPARLAAAVLLYWLVNGFAMLLFGERQWRARAEPFSIFFALVGRCAPLAYRRCRDGRCQILLCFPGHRLLSLPPLPVSGVAFVLLALASVSYDGLSRTFLWLSLVGVNPLEFPGRSAIILSSTLGLLATWLAMMVLFYGSVWLGSVWLGSAWTRQPSWTRTAGRLIYSIIPIALVFQFAHYLTYALVEGQNFAKAIADPFGLGWNITGTGGLHVTTSFLNSYRSVAVIFNMQAVAIGVGHILAVIIAHAIFNGRQPARQRHWLGEVPLAALMVVYTGFGLWLLSTPRV
ncbi:hypothetical protein [Rhizobium sp. SSA_523]|uniref:hypothetical protein n=1 Tax=Rhizobium sp. SSA_523 TaxID=2952477 RepID=UPI002090512A|nr:hypothetical protein [Rhizobium sp. SSA_523]MCO5732231.1 hypothetical protein [Rhizobium sp. SSA_523]WKC21358.1 hypothetical protein QTJ18_05615 [Rhizobium sp. SSA_523]